MRWSRAESGADDETGTSIDSPGLGWADDGQCRGSGHLFFAPERERPGHRVRRERAARALCAACPVMLACRDWAREQREYGFWGGESEEERRAAGYRPTMAGVVTSRRRAS